MAESEITLLCLRNYGVNFGKKKILTGINCDICNTGITQLLGPCGAGKSTLLRSLAGLNDKSSLYKTYGQAFYKGEPLDLLDRPAILEQKPADLLTDVASSITANLPERATLSSSQKKDFIIRLFENYRLDYLATQLSTQLTQLSLKDRRIVLILGLVATAPAMIVLDEPTADLVDAEAEQILDLVREISQHRSIILVQHNQNYALSLGGSAILLAGGTIQEAAKTQKLLTEPESAAGQEFKGTGTCAVPDPNTDPEMLDESFREKYIPIIPARTEKPELIPFGPAGFRWVKRNYLAATPRPGLGGDIEFDLKALARVKIDYLVSLEEKVPISADLASQYGIKIQHLPIIDMGVPAMVAAENLVEKIQRWMEESKRVAVHCKAGLGRTGTILAAYFIYIDMTPEDAIQKIRCIDPRMVQSQEQEVFLHDFSKHMKLKNNPG